jgi:hypothetical protein
MQLPSEHTKNNELLEDELLEDELLEDELLEDELLEDELLEDELLEDELLEDELDEDELESLVILDDELPILGQTAQSASLKNGPKTIVCRSPSRLS